MFILFTDIQFSDSTGTVIRMRKQLCCLLDMSKDAKKGAVEVGRERSYEKYIKGWIGQIHYSSKEGGAVVLACFAAFRS